MTREDVELEAVVRAAESARTKGDVPLYRLPLQLPAPKRRPKPAPKPKHRARAQFDVDKVHRHDGTPKGQDQ